MNIHVLIAPLFNIDKSVP